MIKWFVRTCDFCGQETSSFDGSLIIKEKWYLRNETGWQRKDICSNCAIKLRSAIGHMDEIDKLVEGSIL